MHYTCVLTCVLSLNIVSLWHARMNVRPLLGLGTFLHRSHLGQPSPDMVVVIIKTEPGPLRNFSVLTHIELVGASPVGQTLFIAKLGHH